jgi:hypothetical protein
MGHGERRVYVDEIAWRPRGAANAPGLGPEHSIRKIDNFLPSRLTRGIAFQNFDQPSWRFPHMTRDQSFGA